MNVRRDLPVNGSDFARRWGALSPAERELVLALFRYLIRVRIARLAVSRG